MINFFSCLFVSYLLHLFISCFIPQKPEVAESNLGTASPGPAVICPRFAVCLDLKHFQYINLKGQRWKVHCLSEDSLIQNLQEPSSFLGLSLSPPSISTPLLPQLIARWWNTSFHYVFFGGLSLPGELTELHLFRK